MIYHHFGDKQGLIDAVYGLAAHHVINERNLLRLESRKILHALVVPLLVGNPALAENSAPESVVSTQELQQAVKLLLPVLINRVPASAVELHITAPQWHVFALDMISLVFPGLAGEVIAVMPSEAAVDEVSEDLLTQKKPRYRLASASRRV
jgi:AcrR family transcriptional regulator